MNPVPYRYLIVFGLGAAIHAIWFFGSSPLYQPDAGSYVLSGMVLREGLEAFAGTVSANRVPGYSLFAGLILWPAGSAGMTVLVLVQHALLLAGSLLVTGIGDLFDGRGRTGLVAGVLSCFSFQLFGYAQQPMSEVPFAVMLGAGTLLTLLYLKYDGANALIGAVAVFALAALFRPTAKILPWMLIGIVLLRGVFPGFAWPKQPPGRASRPLLRALLGTAVASAVMAPWAAYNLERSGHFSLTGTFGLNMYSNTIEYGGFEDERSTATKAIRDAFEPGREKRLAAGIPTDPDVTWRQHIPAWSHYMAATDRDNWQADAVLLEAAVDAIKAHPDVYARHVFRNVIQNLVYIDETYRALPGLEAGAPKPWWAPYAIPLSFWSSSLAGTKSNMAPRGYQDVDPVITHEPTAATPVMAALASAYHAFMARWYVHGTLLLTGMTILLLRALLGRDPVAWGLLAFFAFQVMMTALVVPGSARYRIPGDLVFCAIYALPIVMVWDALSRRRTAS